jgi:uncharacterized protein YgbK (DUF1537 family)
MLDIAVIADDLTGAADSGIQFRPLFWPTLLVPYTRLTDDAFRPDARALAVNTNSRPLPAAAAADRVGSAATALAKLGPKYLYKKVDSCLRGNIGAEADALLDALGFELSFVAPAFPAVGRTTAHDVHRVHGVPVAESEMARDPSTPVADSRLSQVISAHSSHQVGHVDIDVLERGRDSVISAVAALVDGGCRHIVFDITQHEHLALVAGLALDPFSSALLVGSAGLAQGLRDILPQEPAPPISLQPAKRHNHHLIVLGTASERARQQVDCLCAARKVALWDLSPPLLVPEPPSPECFRQISKIASSLRSRDCILRLEAPRGIVTAADAARTAAALGRFTAAVIAQTLPATVFLSGGDTALAVFEILGAVGILLETEVAPGLAGGTLVGGKFEGVIVGTKPGAFGDDDVLLRWRENWR